MVVWDGGRSAYDAEHTAIQNILAQLLCYRRKLWTAIARRNVQDLAGGRAYAFDAGTPGIESIAMGN